jgi:gamma-glutamyl:cysteine ligase YbdK (ATP-grasp superfamily)
VSSPVWKYSVFWMLARLNANEMATLDEVCAIAALAQCLVDRLDSELDRGYTLPVPPAWIVRENKWRAARYGLDAEIVVDRHGTVIPVRQAIKELVEDVSPIARRLDCTDELATVERILEGGASYQRQRAVAATNGGDLTAVVDSLVSEMRDGLS